MMRPAAARVLAALLLPLMLGDCMTWTPVAPPSPGVAADTGAALPARMRVWSGEHAYELREAVWLQDSLVGRAIHDGEPVRLGREAVDSVRMRTLRPTATFLMFSGIVVGTGAAIVGLYVVACASGGCD